MSSALHDDGTHTLTYLASWPILLYYSRLCSQQAFWQTSLIQSPAMKACCKGVSSIAWQHMMFEAHRLGHKRKFICAS